ncbi:hypothetical protein [Agrobacterium vitis]|nr:hypothetical protein [Agrobacterium vitis]WEO70869.1 hypothetical protein G6L01_012825 [Agrobacterium vitis]
MNNRDLDSSGFAEMKMKSCQGDKKKAPPVVVGLQCAGSNLFDA